MWGLRVWWGGSLPRRVGSSSARHPSSPRIPSPPALPRCFHPPRSDSNFRKDKFLREKANADADGYVTITVLLTFNRLKALSMGACSGLGEEGGART